jgi:hypothetical protein
VIDEMKQDKLHVSTDGVAGPYLMVPMRQIRRIREILDLRGIRY